MHTNQFTAGEEVTIYCFEECNPVSILNGKEGIIIELAKYIRKKTQPEEKATMRSEKYFAKVQLDTFIIEIDTAYLWHHHRHKPNGKNGKID